MRSEEAVRKKGITEEKSVAGNKEIVDFDEPGERYGEETARAYAAFLVYRDLGAILIS